jgi:hypothetical protein
MKLLKLKYSGTPQNPIDDVKMQTKSAHCGAYSAFFIA